MLQYDDAPRAVPAARTQAIAERTRTIVGVNRFVDPVRDADMPRTESPELAIGTWGTPGTALSEDWADGVLEFEYLRERKGSTGAKSSCTQGGCGACNVMLTTVVGGSPQFSSINACLRPLPQTRGPAGARADT